MEELELFNKTLKEFENAKGVLSEENKEMFKIAYGKGFMDGSSSIIDIFKSSNK